MRDYSLMELAEMLMDFTNRSYVADKAYVEAKEEFQMLDDVKKITFAMIVSTQPGKSEAVRERMALNSPEWTEFMSTYGLARRGEQRARIESDNCTRTWESLRTLISLKKK